MSTYKNVPGVQINEVQLSGPPITGVGTSTAGFVGAAPKAGQHKNEARLVTSADQFAFDYIDDAVLSTPLSRAVKGFFDNGGTACYVVNVDSTASADIVNGIKLLEAIDEVAILAAPGSTDSNVNSALVAQAENTGDRFVILDSPSKITALTELLAGGSSRPADSERAAFYYPRIQVAKQLKNDADLEFVTPVGHIAGVYARVDGKSGVHKAPANERILNALGLEDRLTDAQQEQLNLQGVNAIRIFGEGPVIWGARTLLSNTSGHTYTYVNVRRLVSYIEESLQDGLRWAVFEPNNLALRQKITRSVRGFLDGVWRDGALFGATPDEAYYVKFPEMYNRPDDRAQGKLTIEIGISATYPAEFIVVRIGLLMQNANTV